MKGICGTITMSDVQVNPISDNYVDESSAGGDQFIIKGETHTKKSEEESKSKIRVGPGIIAMHNAHSSATKDGYINRQQFGSATGEYSMYSGKLKFRYILGYQNVFLPAVNIGMIFRREPEVQDCKTRVRWKCVSLIVHIVVNCANNYTAVWSVVV
jgi:hypothetical protein